MTPTRVLRVPDHVHAGPAPGGAVAVLNARAGRWHLVNRTALAVWRECARTGDRAAAVAALAAGHPGVDPAALRVDVERTVDALLDRGLLVWGRAGRAGATPWAAAGRPAERAVTPGPASAGEPLRVVERWAGGVGLVLAVGLLALPFRVAPFAVAVVKRLSWGRPVTARRAERALRAVHLAAGRYPGRVACLELSLGAVLALALRGRSPDWCLGSAGDPLRFHAWVEADGGPVAGPQDPDRGSFREILRV